MIDPSVKAMYVNEVIAGVEHEVLLGLNVGVRYIHRDIPRVLEDVQPFPMVAFDLGHPRHDRSIDYVLTNPGPSTAVQGDFGAAFEDADSPLLTRIEVTADKRLSNRLGAPVLVSLLAPARHLRRVLSVTTTGQSDPGITSLFDFPTNDPSYTTIGVPQFGYRGDVRFLGARGGGPLPLDRPHQFKAFGSYQFRHGVERGCRPAWSRPGKPLTALAGESGLQRPWRDTGSRARGAGFRHDRRVPDPDANPMLIPPSTRTIGCGYGRNEHVAPARRRVQPVQPADSRSTTIRIPRRRSGS